MHDHGRAISMRTGTRGISELLAEMPDRFGTCQDDRRRKFGAAIFLGRALPGRVLSKAGDGRSISLDNGQISVRGAAEILDCTMEDLEVLFRDYGMSMPFSLTKTRGTMAWRNDIVLLDLNVVIEPY
jgi:hypothetical protein